MNVYFEFFFLKKYFCKNGKVTHTDLSRNSVPQNYFYYIFNVRL